MGGLLRLVASLLLVIPLSLAALPNDCAYKIKQKINTPRGWVKHCTPPPDHSISLRIGLPQQNFHALEKHLYDVSNPDHNSYGQHLSKEEVEALVAPHKDSLDAVDEWLSGFGFKEKDLIRSPAKDWIKITVPVSTAEKLLDTVMLPDISNYTACTDLLLFERPIMSGNIPAAICWCER